MKYIYLLCALLSAGSRAESALFGLSETKVSPQPYHTGECFSQTDKGAIKKALVRALDNPQSENIKVRHKRGTFSGSSRQPNHAPAPLASVLRDSQSNYHNVLEALVDKSTHIKEDQLALVRDAEASRLKQCALNKETQQIQAEHAAELRRQQKLIDKLREEKSEAVRLEREKEQSLLHECSKTKEHDSQIESFLANELQTERAHECSIERRFEKERCRARLVEQTIRMQLLSEKRHSRALEQQIRELKEVQKQLERSINCEVAKEAALRRVATFEKDAEQNLQKLIRGEEDREDKLEKRLLKEVEREKALAKMLACAQKQNQRLRHELSTNERAVTQLREAIAMRDARFPHGYFPASHPTGGCLPPRCSKKGCHCRAGLMINQVNPDRSKVTLLASPSRRPSPLPNTEAVKAVVIEAAHGSAALAKVYQSASTKPPPGTKYELVIDGAPSDMSLPSARVQEGTPEWRAAFEAVKQVSQTGTIGPHELAHLQQDLHGAQVKLLSGESDTCNHCTAGQAPHALKHCGQGEIFMQRNVPHFGPLRIAYRGTPCGHYHVYVSGNTNSGLEVDGLAMESLIAGFESITGYWAYQEGMGTGSLGQSPAEFAVDINAGVLYSHNSVRFLKNPISSFGRFSEIVLAAEHVPTVITPLHGSDLEIDTTLMRFYTRLFNLRSSTLYFNDHWSLTQGGGPAIFYIKKNKQGALVAHGPRRQAGQSGRQTARLGALSAALDKQDSRAPLDKLLHVMLNVANSRLTASYASDNAPISYMVPGSSIRLIKLLAHISGWPIIVSP